jgi:hypothetical protein
MPHNRLKRRKFIYTFQNQFFKGEAVIEKTSLIHQKNHRLQNHQKRENSANLFRSLSFS